MTGTRDYPTCAGKRRDGQPCRGRPLPGSRFCLAHDPALAQRRAEGAARGGRNRANVVRLRGLVPPRLLPTFDRLEGALGKVEAGTLTPAQAQALASLARAMVQVLQAGELEERLRDLEAQVLRNHAGGA